VSIDRAPGNPGLHPAEWPVHFDWPVVGGASLRSDRTIHPIPEVLMLIVVLLVALALVALVVAATMAVVLRDDRGAIAEDWAYDTRRPQP